MKGIMMTGFFQNFSDAFYKAVIKDQRYLAYLDGLKITILISIFAILIGIAIGLLVAVVKVSAVQRKRGFGIFNKICNIYITIIRGTPVMVQLLIIYNLIFTSRDTNALLVGAVCFGINSGAYVAEIIRAGIESIDKGQMEAGTFSWTELSSDYEGNHHSTGNQKYSSGAWNEFIVLIKRNICGRGDRCDRSDESSTVYRFCNVRYSSAALCSSSMLSCHCIRIDKTFKSI